MATGDDDDDGDNDDGATTDDVGDGGMGAATGYDDDDMFDGCGIRLPMAARTKARWWGQREMQQSNRGNRGLGGNKRSFTDSHLKDLHVVFVQNEMVPLA